MLKEPGTLPDLVVASSVELVLLHEVELRLPLNFAASRSLLDLIDFNMAGDQFCLCPVGGLSSENNFVPPTPPTS